MAIQKTATMAWIIISILKKIIARTHLAIEAKTIIVWTPELIV